MAVNINLLPAKDKNRYSQTRTNSRVLLFAILCLSLAIGISGALFFYLTTLKLENQAVKDQISNYQTKINSLKTIHDKYSYLANNLSQIDILKAEGMDYKGIINDIATIIPQGVKIDSLQITALPSPNFTLTATARDNRSGIIFYEKMKATPQFSNTVLQSFSSATSNSDTSSSSRVSMTLNTNLIPTPRKTQ